MRPITNGTKPCEMTKANGDDCTNVAKYQAHIGGVGGVYRRMCGIHFQQHYNNLINGCDKDK